MAFDKFEINSEFLNLKTFTTFSLFNIVNKLHKTQIWFVTAEKPQQVK